LFGGFKHMKMFHRLSTSRDCLRHGALQ